jgi:hypothetical protein
MPDLTMCGNKKCPLKETCYRYIAHPDIFQSYGKFYPDSDSNTCEHYIQAEQITVNNEKVNRMNWGEIWNIFT